jgi:Uma2 family endonuclease
MTLVAPAEHVKRARNKHEANGVLRASVSVTDDIVIPGWINDLESYRCWAYSDDYPQSGWVSFLDGQIWVDTSMEELFTHNQVKQAYNLAIGNILLNHPLGRFVPDRMLLSNVAANLSTEPDGLLYLWATMQSGRLRLISTKKRTGYIELEGSPDMVLEIISDSSERKDIKRLPQLYWKANIDEYWRLDVRDGALDFSILRRGAKKYVKTPVRSGWVRSKVLGHEFQLVRSNDPLGHPQFVVNVR